MKKLCYFVLIATTSICLSCEEYGRYLVPTDKEVETSHLESEAILLFTGDYAADGCGYFIELDSIRYKPTEEDSIDSRFQELGLRAKVLIEYELPEILIGKYCGDVSEPTTAPGIRLISIKEL